MRTPTIAGAAVIGLAISPVHASEQTTTFNRVKTAYAESQNIQGCVETDIFVSPFDTNNDGSKGS